MTGKSRIDVVGTINQVRKVCGLHMKTGVVDNSRRQRYDFYNDADELVDQGYLLSEVLTFIKGVEFAKRQITTEDNVIDLQAARSSA